MGKGKNSFNFISEESDLKVENYQPTSQMWHPIVPHALVNCHLNILLPSVASLYCPMERGTVEH